MLNRKLLLAFICIGIAYQAALLPITVDHEHIIKGLPEASQSIKELSLSVEESGINIGNGAQVLADSISEINETANNQLTPAIDRHTEALKRLTITHAIDPTVFIDLSGLTLVILGAALCYKAVAKETASTTQSSSLIQTCKNFLKHPLTLGTASILAGIGTIIMSNRFAKIF